MVYENYQKILLRVLAPPNESKYTTSHLKYFYEFKIRAIKESEYLDHSQPQSAINVVDIADKV